VGDVLMLYFLDTNQCNELEQIFIGIATILSGILALLSAFSIYEKNNTENTLASILKKLSLNSFIYHSDPAKEFWSQASSIKSELDNYNYVYNDWNDLTTKINKNIFYSKIVISCILLFILISFLLVVKGSTICFFYEFIEPTTLAVLFVLFFLLFIPANALINHLVSIANYKNIKNFPTLKSLTIINHIIETKIPDVSPSLPFDLFANSTFFEIFNIADKDLTIIYLKISQKIDNKRCKSFAILMLPIDFDLTGGTISFSFLPNKMSCDYPLDNDKKIFAKHKYFYLMFELPVSFEEISGALITVKLDNDYHLSYNKDKTEGSHKFFPIYFKERPLDDISEFKSTDCTNEKP
jgi:hypothetical protein